MTVDKANNKKRLLIYDGYNSYILTEFIHYCINNILILLLIPHSFHLIQPLNIGIFEPLKYIISFQLDPIFRTGVYCLHKVKWMKSYIKARKIDITPIECTWWLERGRSISIKQTSHIASTF